METPITDKPPGKIFTAILAIMRDIKAVGKTRDNEGQNYKFRGIDDIFNEAHAKFAEHGVFITPTVLEQERTERVTKTGSVLTYTILRIRYTFYAEDGSNVSVEMVGEGMDSGDKSANKSQSVAMKYAIMQLLMIPTSDPKDPEIDNPEPLAKNAPLPGSKASKKRIATCVKDWRTFIWNLPSLTAQSTDKKFLYNGLTLGEIHQTDKEGLVYWIKVYLPNQGEAEQDLRAVLDIAKKDLGLDKEAPVNTLPATSMPSLEAVAKTVRDLCGQYAIPETYILDKFKKKKSIPDTAKTLEEMPVEVLAWTANNFQWFVTKYSAEAAPQSK